MQIKAFLLRAFEFLIGEKLTVVDEFSEEVEEAKAVMVAHAKKILADPNASSDDIRVYLQDLHARYSMADAKEIVSLACNEFQKSINFEDEHDGSNRTGSSEQPCSSVQETPGSPENAGTA